MTAKVLINVPRLDVPGGVAKFYLVLREHLSQHRIYFEIGSKNNESGRMAALKRGLSDYWRFHRLLSKGNISLVHLNASLLSKSMTRDALFLLIARAHSVPVIVSFLGWSDDLQIFIKHRLRPVFQYVLNKAAAIIVLANDWRTQLENMGVLAPIFSMTTCIEDGIFEQRINRRETSQHANILYISRLDRGKGVVKSVRIFALLKRKLPYATLTIVGDGPQRSKAEEIVKNERIDGVRFLGHVNEDDKATAFLEADIFLFPTRLAEGMPIVVLEAMAYGLPVVTRPVGGLKDFFENERMGYMTESSEAADFVNMLAHLIESPELCHRIGHYNRRYAQDHFASSVVAEKLEDIYAKVAG